MTKTDSEQVGIVFDRIMAPNDPEVFVDQVSNLPTAKETVLLLDLLFLQTVSPFWSGNYDEAILASSTWKFDIEIPRVDDEDIKSSTESTNSTSLIHCIASVRISEQVQTSVLNLIFQQAKVAGVRNLSYCISEICSRFWSVP